MHAVTPDSKECGHRRPVPDVTQSYRMSSPGPGFLEDSGLGAAFGEQGFVSNPLICISYAALKEALPPPPRYNK